MNIEIIVMFSIVSFFYIISPGPAIFLALVNGMSGNTKAVVLSSLGNILGLFFLSALSIIGLGSIVLTSATLFFVIKVIGAAYLIYLGIKQFRLSKSPSHQTLSNECIEERPNHSYFTEGLFLAATNPKPILFFIAIFPQFLNVDEGLITQFFIMTTIFMVLSFLSLFSYGYMAKSAKRVFANRSNLKWFHRVTGGLFIGMGFGLVQLKNSQA